MCSLANFPLPPPAGYVTISETHSELVATTKADAGHTQYFQNLHYPEINISQELLRPSMSRESARSAFLEHKDTPKKRIWRAWYEHGLTGVLEELASWETEKGYHGNERSWLTAVACSVLATVRWATSLHGSLFPHLAMSSEDLIAAFSTNSNWHDSYIRCFAWHPHTTKFAIALRDDSVKIYTAARTDIVPILKHKQQKCIADLQWKPASASMLAVACQACVLVWNIDPMSLATRPSTSSAQVLSHPGHCPVTSLAWCPTGGVLITASATDTTMMVWDVAMETCVPLRRVGGGGVSALKWSPDGGKLFAACPSPIFRVWECRKWHCEKWSKLVGRCQAACWSPDGSVLMFATTDEATIYSLTFATDEDGKAALGGSEVAVSCINLAKYELEAEDGKICVGGRVQAMAWDPTGERLAVQFKEGSPELIALFQTRLQPSLEVMPCGFIRGYPGEMPLLLTFQPKFDDGALLTVVWSNGRVAYIPLYFVPKCTLTRQQLYQSTNLNGHFQPSSLYTAEH